METVLIAVVYWLWYCYLGFPFHLLFFASSFSIVVLGGYDYSFLMPYGFSKVSSIILVAIPLFILAGNLMEDSGIAESLINFVDMFVGRIKGRLGIVMVVSVLYLSYSGSGFATLSSIGALCFRGCIRRGYPRGVSAALISSARC